jgi:Ca-activated chloride channel family protein
MWKTERWGGLALAWAALFGALGAVAARAAEPASVVVIFDGSGSMWGNIEGAKASKLVVARDALRRALAKAPAQARVGLASFGHRRGDCNDVEILRQAEPLDVQKVLEPLERLNPRGRGPLTLALREAAKALPAPPGKLSLLLIHDDADNCQPNVCIGAQELRAAGITAHVVGLALKSDDAAKMACLPQITGGRLFNAVNAEQVGTAIEEALRLALGEAGPSEPATAPKRVPPLSAAVPTANAPNISASGGPTAGQVLAGVPKLSADAPAGLYLRALLAPKTEAVALVLNWTVRSEDQPAALLYSSAVASPYVAVPPGRYLVEASSGPLSASALVEAGEKGPTVVDLALNAGSLRIRALAQKSGAALGDALITVSDAGPDGEAKKPGSAGAPLAAFKGSEALAILPPGRYLVRVEQGLVRAERSVVVPVGSQGRIDVPLNAAHLQLSAVGKEISESPDPLIFSIAEDDPDAPNGRREVARSASRQADFVLPPGTYYVIARLGMIEARESVAVGAGDVVKRTLSVAVGRLALATKPVGGGQAPSEPVSYRIERVDSPDVITTSRPSPVLLLPGGRYRVEGRYGAMNARVEREVEVKAGQTQQLTLEHQAASLKLRLMGSSGLPLTEVFWDVRDETGTTVWTTGQPEPSATLQAGRYRVRVETRDKRFERAIELRSGEARVLELAAD